MMTWLKRKKWIVAAVAVVVAGGGVALGLLLTGGQWILRSRLYRLADVHGRAGHDRELPDGLRRGLGRAGVHLHL